MHSGVVLYKFVAIPCLDDAVKLINSSGYYGKVEKGDLVGTEMFGMVHPDTWELISCVLIIRRGAQAYLDYLCVVDEVQGKGMAQELLKKTREFLVRQKVRVVHTCISGENGPATALLRKHKGKWGWPYVNGVIRLEEYNGK